MLPFFREEAARPSLSLRGSAMQLEDEVVDVPVPRALPDTARTVAELDSAMLPESIWRYVADVADRQQSPADFVAVAALCALSGVMGRKVMIQPKQHDDEWIVAPNLWGALIGPPSAMKSPTLKAAVQPLSEIEAGARQVHEEALKAATVDAELNTMDAKLLRDEARSAGRDHQKARHLIEQAVAAEAEIIKPTMRRLIVNDTTVEKLGELLNESPNGLVLVRDELSGWMARMNASDAGAERAFWLEAFNGTGSYTFDRIGRGSTRIESVTVALIGGIQPSKLAPLVRGSVSGQADDGLIQRFQLAVWPAMADTWAWRDRKPCATAKAAYLDLFKRLDDLPRFDPANPDVPVMKFDAHSLGLFADWQTDLQTGIRQTRDMPAALESHLLKMPQTVARLAGLFAMIDKRDMIDQTAMLRALALSDYLRTHAAKVYGLATDGPMAAARLLLDRRDRLPELFAAREVQRKGWSGLTTAQDVDEAIEILSGHGWLRTEQLTHGEHGGRPALVHRFVEARP